PARLDRPCGQLDRRARDPRGREAADLLGHGAGYPEQRRAGMNPIPPVLTPTVVPNPSPQRIWAARVIAMAADLAQVAIFPAFSQGALRPTNDVGHVPVAGALSALLGWPWVFLPSFLSELIPMWDLVPTWTAAVWYVTSGMTPGEGPPAVRVEPPSPPPALKP